MLPHEKAEKLAKWLRGWGVEPLILGPLFVFIVFVFLAIYDPNTIRALFTALIALSPIWIPIFLLRYLWIIWIHYIRYKFWFAQDHVLLEVTLPPEVTKSPLAMEVVLTAIYISTGDSTFISRQIKGAYRPVWALEIASNEGRVSFYMHMRRSWRNIVEARLYGQFPEAKIVEVEDYVSKINFNLADYQLWGCEFAKKNAGALPIRTYYDFALDKDPDTPETVIDPMSHALEVLSSIGKDEYMWLQFILRAHKNDEWYGRFSKTDSFKEGGTKEAQKVIDGAAKRLAGDDKEKQEQVKARGASILTQGEKDKIEKIEKSMDKLVFDVGIRGLYLAKKERYNPSNVGGLATLFSTYAAPDLNTIVPSRGMSIFDYPWQDFHDIRKNKIKNDLFFHYRNRAYFYVPYDQAPVYFNIEELASLWHFPSSSVQPPGLERVASKRAEAPSGLPTGN